VAAVPWFDDSWSEAGLAAVEKLTALARFHDLYFTRTAAAVGAVEQAINDYHQEPA
jgi:hypothetical protein